MDQGNQKSHANGPKLDEFGQAIITRLEKAFPQAIQEVIHFLDELTVVVDHASVVDVCTFLRDDPALAFNYMCDLSAVDMWPETPRFEVNIQLLALKSSGHLQPGQGARRLRVKVRLDAQRHGAKMPTLTSVWPSAAWYEREAHDLFGIEFEGHPDLRPLLLPDDVAQSPKDTTPPLHRDVPVMVEEVAFSFNRERIYRNKLFAKE